MKSLYYKLIIVVSIVILCKKGYAYNNYFDFYQNNMTSAHVADMIRYGGVETALFTGRLNLSIPIYELHDPDFYLNIALSYNSEGFKPLKNSGYVGYNWFLQAGGCITREVRMFPDEVYRESGSGITIEGMLRFIEHSSINKDDVFDLNQNVSNLLNPTDLDSEYMPDIFHFNFLGYQGTFMINNSGKAQIISGDFVEVDLSEIKDNLSNFIKIRRPIPVTTSRITIRTNDGYTYIFGGELAALEYSLKLDNPQQELEQEPPVVSTWHLSKVIAPNGRTMNYYYSGHGGGHTVSENLFVFNQYYDLFAAVPQTSIDPNTGQLIHSEGNESIKFSLTKECILDSICISGTHPIRIQFQKSLANRMYDHGHYGLCEKNYQLNSIIIKSGERVIKSAILDYTYQSNIINSQNRFNWRFLSNVKISGVGNYTFTYNHLAQYPNINIVANAEYNRDFDLQGYWKTTSLQGLLKEVTFPTGGKQIYNFVQHTYGTERRFRRINNDYDLELLSLPVSFKYRGGARISEIKTLIGDSLIEKKTYSYDKKNSYESSGIYYNRYSTYASEPYGRLYVIFSPEFYSLLDTHIAYSYVEERIQNGANSDIYKNAYTFNTGLEYYTTFNNSSINHLATNNDNLQYSIGGVLSYSEHIFNMGKLQQIDYYKNNTICRSRQWRYNGVLPNQSQLIPEGIDDIGCVDTIVIFSKILACPTSRKLFIFPDVVSQETVFDNTEDGHTYMQTVSYSHDAKLRVKKEVTADSRGRRLFTNFTYPDELNAPCNSAYGLLTIKNRIDNPIEITSGYIDGQSEYITSGTLNLYTKGEYAIITPHHAPHKIIELPDSITGQIVDTIFPGIDDSLIYGEIRYYPYLYRTMTLASKQPLNNYQPMACSSNNTVYDTHYLLTCEYKYNLMNRLVSIKPFGKMETKYVWDGIYPVSKKTGNQLYTYTYIPHVGVSSVTDPRGITTYYSYDNVGRLIETYQMVNGNKQILNVYKYHVKTE